MGTHAQAELTEGDPFAPKPQPEVEQEERPEVPNFPPGMGVGQGPGFNQDEPQDPLGNPSEVGARGADLAYLTAAIATLVSAYFAKRAARTSAQAFNDLLHRAQREREFQPLLEALEEFKQKHPETVRRIEQHGERYESAWSELTDHIHDELTPRTVADMEKAIDKHMDAVLKIPLLKRRNRVKEDLKERIRSWKTSRDMRPMMEWIEENLGKDVLRSLKGKAWHGQLELLRLEMAYAHWGENRTLLPLDEWIESKTLLPEVREELAPDGWVEKYEQLKNAEQRAARDLVAEVGAFSGRISQAMGPEVFGPLISLGDAARQPGNFHRVKDGATAWIAPRKVVPAAQQNCGHWLGLLEGRASQASGRYALGGIARRLVWPAAPVGVGLSVGGYYTYEGLRYYLMPGPRNPGDLPEPPDLLSKEQN